MGGAWIAFQGEGGPSGFEQEPVVWFMFDTSLWLLPGDRNVEGE